MCGEPINITWRDSELAGCIKCGYIDFQDLKNSFKNRSKYNKLTNEKIKNAKLLLSDVPDDKVFYVCDGSILTNLNDLYGYLQNIDEKIFKTVKFAECFVWVKLIIIHFLHQKVKSLLSIE